MTIDRPKVRLNSTVNSNTIYDHANAINRLSDEDYTKSVMYEAAKLVLLAGTNATVASDDTAETLTIGSTPTFLPYTDATSSMTMTANRIYYANSASLIVFTLPATFNQNDVFQVIGKGTGGWKIAQNSGQTIRLTSTSTTTGTGGSISSTNRYDNLVLRGLVANTELSATARNGTLTVV